MSTMTKILAAIVLGLAIICGLQTIRISDMKATAAKEKEQHATALATALKDQAEALSEQTLAERKAREERERQIKSLTAKLKTMEDYHARLAPVLHLFLDGLFDRAREPGRMVPTDPERSSRTPVARDAAPPGTG